MDLLVSVEGRLTRAGGRLTRAGRHLMLELEAVGQVRVRPLEALSDSREVLLVAGDQPRVGLWGGDDRERRRR